MSREGSATQRPGAQEPPDGPHGPGGPDGPDDEPWLRPLSRSALVLWWAGAAVVGWLLHVVLVQLGQVPPLVTWGQPVTLLLVTAIVGSAAWQTWRTVRVHRRRLPARRMVNRLALARASAYAGALMAGAYAGYALSWVGVDTELAPQRAIRSGVTALVCLALALAGLALERACRVPGEPRDT